MSTVNLHRSIHHVNKSFEELYEAWQQSLTAESFASERLRGGIARARTRLLSGIPSWRLPDVLNSLAAGGDIA
jgi:hypothetical protein